MRHAVIVTTGLFVMFCTISILRGNEKEAVDAPRPAISIGEMRVQTIPAMSYLSLPAETTFPKMAEPVKAGFDRVFRAVIDNKLTVARPTMLVYEGNPHLHPQDKFKMELGVIVADDAKFDGDGDLKIRKTKPFKCATILYTGPVNEQGQAYQKLVPAIRAAGLKPTGEEREMCLYWEGADSSSNIFMMMVGIE